MSASLRIPAETAPHRACWMAYPYLRDEWPDLAAAQREHEALVLAIAESEAVELLCASPPPALEGHAHIRFHDLPYGDAWTRDTAPIFAIEDGLMALCFGFDGWGGKYLMDGDEGVSAAIAIASGARSRSFEFILEGGAVEFDGEGTLLTTPCLRLANRKPPSDLHSQMKAAFGVECLIEIEGQLLHDHTDGHIDTLARFVRPGEVVCMRGAIGDPNGALLLAIEEQLASAVDAKGRRLKVHTIPSPGACTGSDGELLPASYCNYYLANGQVIVPRYGSPHDDAAVASLAALFPNRQVRGLSSRAIIEGGGSFHCITQQEPHLQR